MNDEIKAFLVNIKGNEEFKTIYDYITKLQNRINNAIIKLEESQKGLEEWHFDGYDPDLLGIINILKGIENEEILDDEKNELPKKLKGLVYPKEIYTKINEIIDYLEKQRKGE